MNAVFISRARQLRSARELLEEERFYSSATALLAVLSAIALNDALLSVWLGPSPKRRRHSAAVKATRDVCLERKVDTGGLKHLADLINNKSAVSYGNQEVTSEKAAALALAARRFEAWMYKICKELAQWEQQPSVPVA